MGSWATWVWCKPKNKYGETSVSPYFYCENQMNSIEDSLFAFFNSAFLFLIAGR